MGREQDDAEELEQWRREARANDATRVRAPVSMSTAIPGDAEHPGRDSPCRKCGVMVPMTGTGVGFAAIVAQRLQQTGEPYLRLNEIMLCPDCDKAREHRRSVEFELFRQEFGPRVQRCKEQGFIASEDRQWFLANDCARTVEGLEERFARGSEKATKRTSGKRADDGAGFGRRP